MKKIIILSQYGWPEKTLEIPEFKSAKEARLAHVDGFCFINGHLCQTMHHGCAGNSMFDTFVDVHDWWGWKFA